MFHLFNRVYLDLDHRIDQRLNRVVLSPNNGHACMKVGELSYGELYHYSKTPQDVGCAELVGILKKLIEKSSKVIIYCDSNTYLRLVGIWYKTMLPDIKYDIFTMLVGCEMKRVYALAEREGVYATNALKTVTYKNIMSLYKVTPSPDKSSELSTFVKANVGHTSLEYHVLRYRTTGQIGSLPRLIQMFIRRFYEELACEYREYALMSTTDNEKLLATELAPLLKYDLKMLSNFDSINDASVDEIMVSLKAVSKSLIGYSDEWVTTAFKYSKYAKASLTMPADTVKEYLNDIRKTRMKNSLFPSKDMENVNIGALMVIMDLTDLALENINVLS